MFNKFTTAGLSFPAQGSAPTSSVSVSVNSIVGSPGGSETLTNAKHFNFLSYSGGTGTYTITLPPAEDGIILRFKTNDTIAAN